MGYVFFSYSRKDKAIIDSVVRELEKANIEVWIDRGSIRGGNQWRLQIVEAIKSSSHFLLALSPFSTESDNVRREVDIAIEYKIQIVVVDLYYPTIISSKLFYQLIGEQIIDLKSDFNIGVAKIIDSLLLKSIQSIDFPYIDFENIKSMDFNYWINYLRQYKQHPQWFSVWRVLLKETNKRDMILDMGFFWLSSNFNHIQWLDMFIFLLDQPLYRNKVCNWAKNWLRYNYQHPHWHDVRNSLVKFFPNDSVLHSMLR